jgi:hypothetical protein
MSNLIQISEKIRDHLTKQRKQSKTPYGGMITPNCAYRGGNGLMCAVGCLIKDEVYSENLESLTADMPEVVNAIRDSLGVEITSDMIQLCMDWQSYHDDSHNGFHYENWTDGTSGESSPELFHIHMMGVHG